MVAAVTPGVMVIYTVLKWNKFNITKINLHPIFMTDIYTECPSVFLKISATTFDIDFLTFLL